MKLGTKKKLAAKVLNVGVNRVVFDSERLPDIKEAITKMDIKGLIKGGAIKAKPVKGASKSRFRKRLVQKRKGRRQGKGSRKGKQGSRLKSKVTWMNKIRLQRKYLKMMKEKELISSEDFRMIYNKASGGFFRSRRHMKLYLQENKLIKENGKPEKKKTR